MSSRALVEAYIDAAVKIAVPELLDDGTIGATVPGCFGVLAFGTDKHECMADLRMRLEDWVRVSLEKGLRLPPLGDIDLNPQAERLLATYSEQPTTGEIFQNEDELEAALSRWDKVSS